MKVLYCLLILSIAACVASAAESNTAFFGGISSTIKSKIYKARDQMPNGFPQYGIPPLAPLVIKHKDINVDKGFLKVDAALDDLVISGLNGFDVQNVKFNLFNSKLDLQLLFKNVTIVGKHDIQVWGGKNGLSIEGIGKGTSSISVTDMSVKVDAKLNMKFASAKFSLKTLVVTVRLGGITSHINGILGNGDVNARLNEFISTEVVDIVNDNVDIVTEVISAHVLEAFNNKVNHSSIGKFMLNEVFDELPESTDD